MIGRAWIGAALVLVVGCASGPMPGSGWERVRDDDCATIEITNDGFADAAIYTQRPRRRIATVGGHSTDTVTVCHGLTNGPTRFSVRPLGGREWMMPQYAPTFMHSGSDIFIYIGPTEGLSYVIGAGFVGDTIPKGARPALEVALWDGRIHLPWAFHIGVWVDVETCIGVKGEDRLSPLDIQWWTAGALVDEASGSLVYGITVISERGTIESIVIERGYWFDAEVVSHEAIHAITGITDEALMPTECILTLPYRDLPLRPAPPELLNWRENR